MKAGFNVFPPPFFLSVVITNISIIACSFQSGLSPLNLDKILQINRRLAQATAKMSEFPFQFIPGDGNLPTPQEMEPMNTWIDDYSFDEDFLQSTAFDATYSGNGHANMHSSGQIAPTSVDYSQNIPTDMQPAGHFTEAFVDQSLSIPTHLLPAEQANLISINQSHNTPTNIQDIGQFTTSATPQSLSIPTNEYLLGQHTQVPINYGGNTTTNVPPDVQATQPTIDYSDNSTTNVPPKDQAAEAQFHHNGSPHTNIPLNGQATPAPAQYSGNENANTQATGTSPPASTQRKGKHPAVVEDKRIERCAHEYNFSYDEVRILLDYANARLKGIETNEPKDAPSRYIISRFEQVRRTYPDHATWPYDIPEANIIKFLPGQKRQSRAPPKSYHSASEKQRQELDARYQESRQWQDPPPPKPDQTHQNTLTAPAIDNVATGLNPPPSWDFNLAEAAETSTMTQHDSTNFSVNVNPPALSYDFRMDGIEGQFQLPSPPLTAPPTQPDSVDPWNYIVNGPEASDDIHMAGLEEPAQLPAPLPTLTPMEQDMVEPLDSSGLPAVSDDSQYDYLFEEPLQRIGDSELDEYFEEPAQPLPTLNPPEKEIHWPFHQDQSKEERPFRFPYLDFWPIFAPIICHPLVRALELHTGRKDPSEYRVWKGYTIPVSHYKDSVKKIPAPADWRPTPESCFMPQGYKMTEELRREIEQRVGIYMKLRWGIDDDDDGEKARSGELVREDLRRLEMECPTWRYKMAVLVDKWGLGGLQDTELSSDYFHQMVLKGLGCIME